MKFKFSKIILPIIIAVALFLLLVPGSCTVVGPNQRGVKVTLGQVSGDVLQPGVNFHIPVISKIQCYSIAPSSMVVNFSVGTDGAISKDMQTVGSSIEVFYKYDETRIMDVVTQYNNTILQDAIRKNLIASLKEVVGKYSIYELVEYQDEIQSKVLEALKSKIEIYPIIITQLTISNWDWSDDFDKQIKETMLRTQQVKQAEQDLKLAETNSQKQIKEAESKRLAEQQNADAELYKAEQAAKAKKLEADALAYYNAKVAQNYNVEIKLKELEIELERAKKWDGREVSNYIPLAANGTVVDLGNKQ